MSPLVESNPTPTTAMGAAPAPADVENPYKGLDYFQDSPGDHAAFAGRDAEIREIVARIVTQRALVVYGRSGLGKTSLLLAGVFPELRARDFYPVYVRATGSPIDNLTAAIKRACNCPSLLDIRELPHWISQANPEGTLVLVFDQFEEFFIQFRERHQLLAKQSQSREDLVHKRAALAKERDEFVELISSFVGDPHRDAHVVFSLREDYLAALDGFQRQLPDLFRDSYRLLPLTAFGARQAIVRPLMQATLPYDERLITRLVNELADFDFDSARLQITCLLLFRLARKDNQQSPRLKEEYLNQLLGARGCGLEWVFRLYVEEALKSLNGERDLLSRIILDALITPERTKRAMTWEELRQLNFDTGANATKELETTLEALCAHQIVRSPTEQSGGCFELVHECLIPEILKWLEGDRQFASFRRARDITATGCMGDTWRERPEFLLFEQQLTEVINPHKERLRPDATQLEFLVRSSIYRGSKDAGYWAGRFDHAKGVQILLAALAEPNADFRRAAATVTAQFKDADHRLSERCWELALQDERDDVRHAAGRSFAAIASTEDLTKINAELRLFGTRKHVVELLANWSEEDRKRAGVNRWWRWRARRESQKGIWKEHQEDIEKSRSIGTRTGLWSSLVWGLICLPAFALIFGWIANPWYSNTANLQPGANSRNGITVYTWAFIGFLGLGVAAYLGRRAALAGARTAAVFGELNGSLAVRRMWIPFAGALVVVLSLFVAVGDEFEWIPHSWRVVLTLITAPLMVWALRRALAFSVRVSYSCMQEARSLIARLVWCYLINIEFFLVLPSVMIVALLHYLENRFNSSASIAPSDLCEYCSATMLAGSFFHWIFSLSLIESARTASIRTNARSIRGPVIATLFFSMLWLVWRFGTDSLLGIPTTITDHRSSFGKLSGWPKTSHYQIESSNRLFRVTLPNATKVSASNERGNLGEPGGYENEGDLLFLPSGKGALAVESYQALANPKLLTPIPTTRGVISNLTAGSTQMVECELQWSGASQAWSGEIAGQLPPSEGEQGNVAKLYASLAGRTLFRRASTLTQTQFSNYLVQVERPLATNAIDDYVRVSVPVDFKPRWFALPPKSEGYSYGRHDSLMLDIGLDGAWKVSVSLIPNQPEKVPVPTEPENATMHQDRIEQGINKVFHPETRPLASVPPSNNVQSVSLFIGIALNTAAEDFTEAERLSNLYRTNDAIKWYSVAVRKSPRNAGYQNQLARQLYLMGRSEQALNHAEAATQLRPDDAYYWDTLAHIAQGLQKWDEAVHAWDQVLKLEPRHFDLPTSTEGKKDKLLYEEAKRRAAMTR